MNTLKDKNGKTEAEFLRDYDVTKYFRPSVTVDALLYCADGDCLRLLLIKRGGHPYLGCYAFPGGFVDEHESCEEAVSRELKEETSVAGIALRQLVTVSTPLRDPRARNITVAFCGKVASNIAFAAGDDASDAEWFDITFDTDGGMTFYGNDEKFTCKLDIVRDVFGRIDLNATSVTERGKIAFDHAKVIWYLYEALRRGDV